MKTEKTLKQWKKPSLIILGVVKTKFSPDAEGADDSGLGS